MPELDDEFAQAASEFDTLGELRAGTRAQLQGVRKMQQAGQARERALDALLEKIDIPLPDKIVAAEVEHRKTQMTDQLQRMGSNLDDYLESVGQSPEEFDTSLQSEARQGVKTGFVLDQLALQEELGVEPDEMSAYVADRAQRMGVDPNRLAQQLAESGQLGSVASEVLRVKAMDIIAQRAKVTDADGNEVDLQPPAAQAGEEAGDGEQAPGGTGDETADDTDAAAGGDA
jgi:trigger factor